MSRTTTLKKVNYLSRDEAVEVVLQVAVEEVFLG